MYESNGRSTVVRIIDSERKRKVVSARPGTILMGVATGLKYCTFSSTEHDERKVILKMKSHRVRKPFQDAVGHLSA